MAAAPSASATAARPPFSLAGKSAVVTGAASGIGLAVAHVFAKAGAHVCLLDCRQESLEAATAEVNALRPAQRATAHVCDVTDELAVAAAFDAICAGGSRIDALVCNAGVSAVGTLEQSTGADMDRCYQVNVKGVFHCLKHGVRLMLADGKGGAIVNLASIASLIGLADRFVYSMTKGAVLTMTYSVATDYVKKGIRCNCVCPARVHTPFVDNFLKKHYAGQEAAKFKALSEYQPIGRMGRPEEIAHLILYLCTDEAGFVTGAAFPIDGGVTCRM